MKLIKTLLSASALLLVSASAQTTGEMIALSRIPTGVKSKHVSSYDRTGGNNDRISIPDGEKATIFDVSGAGVITRIWITMAPPPEEMSRNDVLIRMYWDGHDEASVTSPIGPFFGQGWDESYPFISAPLAAAPREGRAMVSYFAMPFSDGARIEVENQTGQEIRAFYFNIDYTEVAKLPDDSGRFHASYRHELTEAPPEGENEWGVLGKQGENPLGAGNYLVADIQGRGQFVGLNYYVQSPSPMWYGEGDEMVFIDGESKPSIVGTGTEDYFNMSWSPKEVYMHPYFGAPRVNDGSGWIGRTHCYRFHIADPIHFDKSLKFTIEHGHNNCLTLDLATVAYWYQTEASAVPPIPDKAGRAFMPGIGASEILRWRDAWRRAHGGGATLWGNETSP